MGSDEVGQKNGNAIRSYLISGREATVPESVKGLWEGLQLRIDDRSSGKPDCCKISGILELFAKSAFTFVEKGDRIKLWE